MSRDAVLIVNTKSRRGRLWFEQAHRTLTRQGITLSEAVPLREPKLVLEVTRSAVARGASLVIVGGGDGTLSAVARCFVGSDSILGVLPMGTGNQFARDLGIPANIEAACRIISEGIEADVDLGTINDDYFLNVTTVGVTAQIVRELTPQAKRTLGRFAYAQAVWRALRKARPFEAHLKTPEGENRLTTTQLVVGNGRYHAGPFPLSPEASITDGTLDVYALTDMSPRSLFQFMLHMARGSHAELPFVHAARTTRLTLETNPPQRVVVDGEIQFRTPVTLGVQADALRVMVPPTWHADTGREAAKQTAS
jgi:diacylglycerol kinase (ATP)